MSLHRFASHVWCCFPSVLFETQNISNCRISLRVLQGKNARCKGPKRDNDWSTWPSKRPRNSNTTSSASMWNLSLWMRNKHSSTMKNPSICFNRMGDFTDLRDTFYILTCIYMHIHSVRADSSPKRYHRNGSTLSIEISKGKWNASSS